MKCLNCNREFGTPRENCPFCGADMTDQGTVDVNQNVSLSTNPVFSSASSMVSSNPGSGELIPLTISREKRIMGFAISFTVFVDGVRVGILKNGKSLSCQVGQGVHEILIKCVEKDVRQSITVLKSNQSVDVITRAKMGLLAAVVEIKNVIYK